MKRGEGGSNDAVAVQQWASEILFPLIFAGHRYEEEIAKQKETFFFINFEWEWFSDTLSSNSACIQLTCELLI